MLPKVEILMSTYNGEKYIVEQIKSILNQINVNVHLSIRDDGSTDSTVQIIKELIKEYPTRITLHTGENLGYRKSFLYLLKVAQSADYYGFADQDDVWLPEKLEAAVKKLKEMDSSMALYASSIRVVDEELNEIGKNDISNMPNTIGSYFTRARLAGCTYVFTSELKRIVERFSDVDLPATSMPDHDFVVGSCAFACGQVYLDSKSYILHRRHQKSVTSGGNGLLKRIKTEWKIVFKRKNVRSIMARKLLFDCDREIKKDAKYFLTDVVNYKKNVLNRIAFAARKDMSSSIWVCDLEQKFKILIGNY